MAKHGIIDPVCSLREVGILSILIPMPFPQFLRDDRPRSRELLGGCYEPPPESASSVLALKVNRLELQLGWASRDKCISDERRVERTAGRWDPCWNA